MPHHVLVQARAVACLVDAPILPDLLNQIPDDQDIGSVVR